ncbi:MAG: hypothetical protein O3C40_33170 [Planctomycetota bacterium]|nr:hypothetical protein [Planctomycetota bacterium]
MSVDRFTNKPPVTTRRRGSMFVETAIGITLAVVVMIAVAQLVAIVAKQRREVSQTRLATQEVANVMERLMVLSWDELTTEATTRFAVSEESAADLDDPQMSITVSDLDDSLPSKTIEIALSWRDQANRRVDPVRLVAWKHRVAASE